MAYMKGNISYIPASMLEVNVFANELADTATQGVALRGDDEGGNDTLMVVVEVTGAEPEGPSLDTSNAPPPRIFSDYRGA